MANSYLVHERNLDPDLRAKVNGIKQTDDSSLSNMVTKQELANAITKIDSDVTNNINNIKNVIDENYYSKDDIISKNSLHIAFVDINENTRLINNLNKKIDDSQNNLSNNVTTLVDKRINELGLSQNASDYTEIQKKIQNNSDAINQNILNINKNLSKITSIQDNVNNLLLKSDSYRKTADKITKNDLSNDFISEIEQNEIDISLIKNTKQDKIICTTIGPVYNNPGNIIQSMDFVIRGNFCNTSKSISDALSVWNDSFYDIINGKHYSWKDTYNAWNYNSNIDNISHNVNASEATGYKRYSLLNNYISNKSDAVSITDGHIMFSKACTFTFGFYGTKIKILGKMLKYDASATDPSVSVSIDGSDVINNMSYRYTSAVTTNAVDYVALLDITELSIGRHVITLNIPDSCPLVLDGSIDINNANAAILNKNDILINYQNIYFDNQDNWETIPASYNITKTDSLFNLSSLTTDKVYDIKDFDVTDETGDYNNHILASTMNNDLFIVSGGKLYKIEETTDTEIDKLFT